MTEPNFLPPVVAEIVAKNSDFMAKMRETKAEMAATAEHGSLSFGALSNVGKAALGGIAVAAVGIGVASIKMAGDFQESMTQLVTGAGESEANIGLVSSGILDMAGKVGQSTKALADGMFLIESAGYRAKDGLTVLKVAAEGARVGNANLADVANAVTSALNAYHLPATDATEVMNTLTATVANGKMHMEDLAGALSTVMPAAAALHVPLEQVGGALATMTMQGITADNAATYLRFTLLALVNPTAKARGEMEAMGISSAQVADVMTHQGLPQALEVITDAISKKFKPGSAEYTAALANMVGGTRGMQAALALTGDHLATFQNNVTTVSATVKAGGDKVAGWSDVQKDFNFKLAATKDAAEALTTKLGIALLPVVEGLIKDTTKAVDWAEKHKTATWALAIVIGGPLVAAVGAYTISLAAAAIAELIAFAPMILGAIAAGLLAVAVYELATHWKEAWNWIKDAVANAWHFVKDHLDQLGLALGPSGPVLAAGVFLIDHWRGIWFGIETAVSDAWEFIRRVFEDIKSGVEDVVHTIDRVGNAISNIPGAGAITGIISHIPGLAEGGLVTKPTLAMIGEGGAPELVLPLSNPARMSELLGLASMSVPTASILSGASGGQSASSGQSSSGGAQVSIQQHWHIDASGTSAEIVDQIQRAVEANNRELFYELSSRLSY